MQNRIFQNTCNQLRKEIDRRIGIMDENGAVIACSDEMKIGQVNDQVASICSGIEAKASYGYTYKKIETYNKIEYFVFCEGEDELARCYCAILGTHFTTLKQYYDEKYDKNSFVKNIILDNVLPGDIMYRSRELRLSLDAKRHVFLIRCHKNSDVSIVDILLGMFPDKIKDFIIRIDDRDVAVVREEREDENIDVMQIANEIRDTIGVEAMVKVSVGVSTLAENIQELSKAYREARIALEVGKVFDTEKNVISYDNLGIGRLIYQLPTTLCELFLNEVLKKESIDVMDSETIYTIQKFFENNLNVSETSRKLFVHRNTLVYRLDKIKKLTGIDLREFDDAITFKVAMMVNKYLTSEPTRI